MEKLPIEIRQSIFALCSNNTIRKARAACKEWFNFFDFRNFVTYFTRKEDWPQIATHFASYNEPITLRLAKNVMQSHSEINEHLSVLTNLTGLEIDNVMEEYADDFKLAPLTNLQHVTSSEGYITLKSVLPLPNLTKVAPNCTEELNFEELAQGIRSWTNLEYLNLSEIDPINVDLFENYHTRLTHLECDLTRTNKRTIQKWLRKLGNLKEFHLDEAATHPREGHNFLSLKSLTSLERLHMQVYHIHQLNSTRLTQLSIFKAHDKVINKELDHLVNLRQFSVQMFDDERLRLNFTFDWLTALTALEDLSISPIKGNALQLMTTRLTSLKITVRNMTSLELRHLTRFASLKHLHLSDNTDDSSVLSTLALLTQLNSLELLTDRLSVSFLSSLSNLTQLTLRTKHADISNLPNLEELTLRFSYEVDYVGFVDLPKLTRLSYNGWTEHLNPNFAYLSKLTTLKYLSQVGGRRSQPGEIFSALTSLEYLYVHNLEDFEYDFFSSMTRLTSLQLASRAIPSPTLLRLPTSLQVLDIHRYLPGDSDSDSEDWDWSVGEVPHSLIDLIIDRLPNLYKHSISEDY